MEPTLKIFDKLDVTIDPSNIEDCCWLKSNGPKKVMIKFARRKDTNLIRKNKNKLKGMNLCLTSINNPVFINDSLCSYYKMLWRKCKNLWCNKYISCILDVQWHIKTKVNREWSCTYNYPLSRSGWVISRKWTSEGRTIGPLFVCFVYFYLVLWLIAFILQFPCFYFHVLILRQPFCFFTFC